MDSEKNEENYWSQRYKEKQTGWDIGYPSTPIKEYIDQLADKNISILIPGCGNAYEADYLLQKEFVNVTLLDISSALIEKIQKTFAAKKIKIIQQNFFKHQQQYDLVLEQTFFCALNPSLRTAYADKMIQLLRPGGKLAGVLFNREFNGGPPYGGNEKEYRELFCHRFSECKIEACYNSIPPRKGSELFIQLKK
ncbi:MAG TPA: methyltransferase [Chitinophagaceae bacterium]